MPAYLRHSLLDRLTDEDPEATADAKAGPSAAALVRGVMRDVEDLLNTTRSWPPARGPLGETDGPLGETDGLLAGSILAFGVPDLASYAADDGAARLQAELIREALDRFEPRLVNVRVVPVEVPKGESGRYARTVRLEIRATLKMDPLTEPLTMTTDIDPLDGTCRVAPA